MAIFTHRLALCESDQVGDGTRIWAFAHVMSGACVGRDCNIGEGAFIESGAALGDRVTVKNHALIWDGVTIADDVFVGPAVILRTIADRAARGCRRLPNGTRTRPVGSRRPTSPEGRAWALGR